MKVSVIIPVYNVEKYFPRCIKSVIEQTYDNLEIILVDDGSVDNSGRICDDFALIDRRIRVIHKNNGGLSSARNVGIEIASGDAFLFIDSDDYISKDCIAKMVALMQDNNADIVIVRMRYISESINEEYTNNVETEVVKLTSERAIEESLYQRLFTCCTPAKLFKKNVVGSIRFPLGKVSEDLATCHLFFHNAVTIVYTDYYGYYYRQHESSIMHVFNSKRLDALEWTAMIENFCSENYPLIINAAYCRSFNVAIHLILDLPNTGEEHNKYYSRIWNEITRTRMKTLFNIKSRNREKVAAILSFGGEKVLKTIWNSKFAVKKG